LEHFGLAGVTGDAVEDKRVGFGMETACFGGVIDELVPKADGRFIRNEFAAAGVFQENFADGAVGFQAAEYVTAGAVKEMGYGAENLALSALARAWGAKEQDRAKLHGASLCLSWISLIS